MSFIRLQNEDILNDKHVEKLVVNGTVLEAHMGSGAIEVVSVHATVGDCIIARDLLAKQIFNTN